MDKWTTMQPPLPASFGNHRQEYPLFVSLAAYCIPGVSGLALTMVELKKIYDSIDYYVAQWTDTEAYRLTADENTFLDSFLSKGYMNVDFDEWWRLHDIIVARDEWFKNRDTRNLQDQAEESPVSKPKVKRLASEVKLIQHLPPCKGHSGLMATIRRYQCVVDLGEPIEIEMVSFSDPGPSADTPPSQVHCHSIVDVPRKRVPLPNGRNHMEDSGFEEENFKLVTSDSSTTDSDSDSIDEIVAKSPVPVPVDSHATPFAGMQTDYIEEQDIPLLHSPPSSPAKSLGTGECGKPWCALGCVCESIQGGPVVQNHCKYVQCMFRCMCVGRDVPDYFTVESRLRPRKSRHPAISTTKAGKTSLNEVPKIQNNNGSLKLPSPERKKINFGVTESQDYKLPKNLPYSLHSGTEEESEGYCSSKDYQSSLNSEDSDCEIDVELLCPECLVPVHYDAESTIAICFQETMDDSKLQKNSESKPYEQIGGYLNGSVLETLEAQNKPGINAMLKVGKNKFNGCIEWTNKVSSPKLIKAGQSPNPCDWTLQMPIPTIGTHFYFFSIVRTGEDEVFIDLPDFDFYIPIKYLEELCTGGNPWDTRSLELSQLGSEDSFAGSRCMLSMIPLIPNLVIIGPYVGNRKINEPIAIKNAHLMRPRRIKRLLPEPASTNTGSHSDLKDGQKIFCYSGYQNGDGDLIPTDYFNKIKEDFIFEFPDAVDMDYD